MLEGPVVLTEALNAGAPVTQVFLDPSAEQAAILQGLAEAAGIPVTLVDDHVMRSLSGTATPQGVLAICSMTDVSVAELPENLSLVLVLAGIQDPGNAGTLIRSAVAAGADAVLFSDASVDPYSAKTVRSSAGLISRITLVREASFAELRKALNECGLRVVGADAGATTDYDSLDLRQPVAFVVGNEANGLPEEEAGNLLDVVVQIPMPGPAESLNVASAGSLLLFEAVRQRRLGSQHE